MKKLMPLMLGLTIALGSVAMFAQDAPKTDTAAPAPKMEKKKKAPKKKAPKKADETKKEGTR
jgi:hypothetical protein